MECTCSRCGETKDCSEFRSRNICKVCRDLYMKTLNKNWRINNREKDNRRSREWRKNNPQKVKDISKKYYNANKESCNSRSNTYHKLNRSTITLKEKERINNDISFRIKKRLRSRIKSAIKLTGSHKHKSTSQLIGCTIVELRIYIASKFLPTMTWENYGKYWHIDHIIPCSKFDLTKEEEQQKCFHYTNLQPLFAFTTIIDGIEYIGNVNKRDKIIKN